MKKAILIYQSGRTRTYVDAAASMLDKFDQISEYTILFHSDLELETAERARLQAEIWASAEALGRGEPLYAAVAKLEVNQSVLQPQQLAGIFSETRIVDVSGASKELTTEIVARAIQRGNVSVGVHVWDEPIDTSQQDKEIGSDPYQYVELTALESNRRLRTAFSRRTKLLYTIASFLFLAAALSIGAIWFETLEVVNSVLVSVSVVVSFAALAYSVMDDERR